VSASARGDLSRGPLIDWASHVVYEATVGIVKRCAQPRRSRQITPESRNNPTLRQPGIGSPLSPSA